MSPSVSCFLQTEVQTPTEKRDRTGRTRIEARAARKGSYRLAERDQRPRVRQWDLVDQDTLKRTKALESMAASLKTVAGEQ